MGKTQTNSISKLAVLVIALVFIAFRWVYLPNNTQNGNTVTTWDAFGYYMYLPSAFIYHDFKNLEWIPEIDSTYQVTGGYFYQATQLEEGTFTNKYLGGVAIMQLPFFGVGHLIATISPYPSDGFSAPYQYSIMIGALFCAIIGFVFLRKVLLRYFDDNITAITLLFIGLTSNLIQYVSVDSAMSHAYLFPLYAILLYYTIKWHEKPTFLAAIMIGLTIGIATISRPTELIMVFIPLLWNTTQKEIRKEKWQQVVKYKTHLLACVLAGIIAISPQLMYWQHTTGSLIYDVGSKWYFLNPWFRVLVGPEKGWFLYTPVAILMVIGFFFMKDTPYKRSILLFCILNIWIIIAWSDWRYGASYSTRALTQSYPVFALPLASLLFYFWKRKGFKTVIIILFTLLLGLNFYQLKIYNSGTIESFSPFLF